MAKAPQQLGIGIRRHFTTPGTHPYDTVEWEQRDAWITNFKDDDRPAFAGSQSPKTPAGGPSGPGSPDTVTHDAGETPGLLRHGAALQLTEHRHFETYCREYLGPG